MNNQNSDSVNLGSNPSPPANKPLVYNGFSYPSRRSARITRDARSHKKSHTLFDETGWREKLTQKIPRGLKTVVGFLIVFGIVLGGYLFGDDKSEEDRDPERGASFRIGLVLFAVIMAMGLGFLVRGLV